MSWPEALFRPAVKSKGFTFRAGHHTPGIYRITIDLPDAPEDNAE